jgi:flagellar assembly factor FliW
LVFLQSLRQPELCFLAFPILVADREYRLAVCRDDLEALELDDGRQPNVGSEVLVLALVSLHDGFSATANLMAPIVLNLKTLRGLQAIRQDNLYSHQHPIQSYSPEVAC